MKIIEPSVELINAPDYKTLLTTIEAAGRTCSISPKTKSRTGAQRVATLLLYALSRSGSPRYAGCCQYAPDPAETDLSRLLRGH